MPVAHLPSPIVCDRARAAKDARFDGLFFTAVRTTGIYCRPVCPAPAAARRNVTYFPTAAAAATAGYRPCLRCRPELAPEQRGRDADAIVERALALIAAGVLQDGSIVRLAEDVGVGARHLRRLLLARTGATPLAMHATRRLLLAKQLLTETTLPVTQVALAAGFNSVRRFNAAFARGCGMPPTALRRRHAPANGEPLTLRLGYRPPLAFSDLLEFLARRALPGIEHVRADSYERVIGPAHASTRIHVSASADRPELLLRIDRTDPRTLPAIVRCVRRMFDLDADPAAMQAAFADDPLLARALEQRPGLRIPGGWDGFEIAVRAVLGQQVSVAGATTLSRRLVEAFGARRAGMAAPFDRAFPSPRQLREAPLESIGLPRARAASLHALAGAVLDGRLHFGPGQRLDTFVAGIATLPGIGAWTAHYVALRALGHPDAFPAGDLVLQRLLGGGERMPERLVQARAHAWRPWRAYAAIHLWHLANDRGKEKH